ncbi:MAG: hypothetical protein AAF531_20575 [Actinomycetota bacterium]
MRRSVRVEDAALDAVVAQLIHSSVSPERFVALDLVRERLFLETRYDDLPAHGPGRRHTQHEPATVALFHVFAVLDDDGAVVVYHIDIWVDEPPEPPEDL